MKIDILGEPVFIFHLSTAQAEAIVQMSAQHYDAVCRVAGCVGGFAYGWANAVSLGEVCRASWRELDTALKIMEFKPLGATVELLALRRGLIVDFNVAMDVASRARRTWTTISEVPITSTLKDPRS